MKDLTKAESQLMKYLWKLGKAYLKDIVELYPDPKPAYTTISTVVNVLVKKGWIGFETHGRARQYFPVVARQSYLNNSFKGLLSTFFDGSPRKFASYFAESDDLTTEELEDIRSLIDEQIKKQR